MLFSGWYEIMVNKVIFVGFGKAMAPTAPVVPTSGDCFKYSTFAELL